MIEINLLPEELRVKAKAKNPEQVIVKSGGAFNPERLFIYAIPALLALFIFMHVFFVVITIFKNAQVSSLNRQLLVLGPQKKVLDEFNKEYSAASQDASFSRLLIKQRILWAQKLNKLSLYLPAGVWFTDIKLSSKNINIQGSVISLQKEEVGLINKLLDNLKADAEFSKDFVALELDNVQKKNIGGYDIADFVLSGALQSR